MKRFAYRALGEVLLGLAFGATVFLLLRVVMGLLSDATRSSRSEFLRSIVIAVVGAGNFWVVVAIIVGSLLLFFTPRVRSFFLRLYRSWSGGIITGILPVWFILVLVFFMSHAHFSRKRALLFVVLGLLPIVASWFVSCRRPTALTDFSISIPEPGDLPDNLVIGPEVTYDLPIQKWTEDRLKRGDFVQSIAELVLKGRAPVIGIVGPFGEGKTSTLNLLAVSLNGRRDLIVVPFSSWLPGDERTLSFSLFATIAERIKTRYLIFGLSGELRRFARLLAGALPRVGGSLSGLFDPPSQVEQLQGLKRLLNELPARVVVLVDELDRMDRAELLMLLKAIRGVTDLPNVTYICAFDKKAVVRLISEKDASYGESYLEKFFPIRKSLPRTDQELLSKYFDHGIERICGTLQMLQNEKEKAVFNEAVRPLWRKCMRRILTNIRKMTLFLNALEGSLRPVSAEVNLFDMVVLQLVKITSEDTYEFIYDNGSLFYEPSWRVTHWEERLAVDEATEARIRDERLNAFFNSLADMVRTRVTELLSGIFPSVDACIHRNMFSRRAKDEEGAEAERRICHPDYFPRYFIHQVPAGLFGKAEMARFIAQLNAGDNVGDVVAVFQQWLADLASNPWKRWNFLDNLSRDCGRLGEVQSEGLVIAVARISDSLEEDVLGLGEWGRARAILFAAANRFSGTPRLQEVLSSAIREATSDGFAVDIVRYSTNMREQNKIITDWANVDESAIKRVFAHRMRGKYDVGSQREVPYDRRAELPPFLAWASVSEEDRILAAAFFRDRFRRHPVEVGKYLGWFLPKAAIYEGDPLIGLDRLFPVDELLELARRHGDGTWIEKDRESVNWFKELMDARGQNLEADSSSHGSSE